MPFDCYDNFILLPRCSAVISLWRCWLHSMSALSVTHFGLGGGGWSAWTPLNTIFLLNSTARFRLPFRRNKKNEKSEPDISWAVIHTDSWWDCVPKQRAADCWSQNWKNNNTRKRRPSHKWNSKNQQIYNCFLSDATYLNLFSGSSILNHFQNIFFAHPNRRDYSDLC